MSAQQGPSGTVAIAFAKLAGVRTALKGILGEKSSGSPGQMLQDFPPGYVGHYFATADDQFEILRQELPDLYDDFPNLPTQPQRVMPHLPNEPAVRHFARYQVDRLARDIDHAFEIRANSELAAPIPASKSPRNRVFVSHGRAPDWREVQRYIEQDVGLATLELAQEANQGMTVLQKLENAAKDCDSAVIVMTGDDVDAGGTARARENVIHEIGYFQGKFGLSRIVLLHEDGVSIPSNVHGLVYSPFPNGLVSATFGLLMRELRAMYSRTPDH